MFNDITTGRWWLLGIDNDCFADDSSFWQEIHDLDFQQLQSSQPLRAIDNMIWEGWCRTRADFDQVQQNIWAANNHAVERLLRDL
jgi:hypothetical protein